MRRLGRVTIGAIVLAALAAPHASARQAGRPTSSRATMRRSTRFCGHPGWWRNSPSKDWSPPEVLRDLIAHDYAKWARIIKEAGITAE